MPGRDSITLAELQEACRQHERLLRAQDPEEALPPALEGELASLVPTNIDRALSRLTVLKMAYRDRWREREERAAAGAEGEADAVAQEAVRQLVRREPVVIQVAGRDVAVTGRSYAAMYEIAAHALRVAELEEALRSLEGSETYRRVAYEAMLHRRAIWAHALTPSGAPARSLKETPEFWDAITPVDDARLLGALFDVMHGRYARLGAAPEPAGPADGAKRRESFGWHTLLLSLEAQARVEPASFYDRDLFQLLARERASAHLELGDMEEALR